MLRTTKPQLTLWESILPQCCLALPGDLADELLEDERFFEPFRPFFDPVMGRPSIPIEVYLRMIFLKYRYRLGYQPGPSHKQANRGRHPRVLQDELATRRRRPS